MIEHQNLPFQDSHYLTQPEHVHMVRDHIHNIVQYDLRSLQQLLMTVQDTLSHHMDEQSLDPLATMRQKEKESKLFQQLSRQNRQRSQNITSMGQLTEHLLDYIEQQHHKNVQIRQNYQLQIQQLSNTIDQLTFRRVAVQNDILSFKEQLHRAKDQIEHLVQEKQDQKGYFQENQDLKNHRICQLEMELEQLTSKLKFYKRSSRGVKQVVQRDRNQSLRYVYSQSQFFPISMLQNEYQKMTLQLECQNTLCLHENENKKELQLQNALQSVLSNKSLVQSEYSGYLYNQKSRENLLNNNVLSLEVQNFSSKLDILPFNSPSYKVTYITQEDQALQSSPSRDIFEFIDEKYQETAASIKDIDKNYLKNKGVLVVKANSAQIPKKARFVSTNIGKKSRDRFLSFVSKNIEPVKNTCMQTKAEGICTSLLNYLVSKRIKRNSQKANSGCPTF